MATQRSPLSRKMENQVISKNSTILAVGATGQFAGLVVPELAKRGAKVRGLILLAARSVDGGRL
jgi:short subunit dehydrogenase-like uncharacterized protein